jgi:DNA polymerase IIIc chi subunit
MSSSWAEFKAEVISQYQEQKKMADAALGRVDDATFFAHLTEGGDQHTNSPAILVKHISGNFISRWTDFLTSDGEKADRQRPREFLHEESDDRTQIMQHWEEGWRILFATLDSLTDEDFAKTVFIRNEAHTVVKATLRNLLHATHHIGQIDLLVTALNNHAGERDSE